MTFVTPARALAVSATLLLAVSLGGTSYAAVKIGTKQLRNNAVVSAKIKNDSVTGKDVKESTLGKVPQSALADFATNADTSQRSGEAQTLAGTTVQNVQAETAVNPGRPFFPYVGDDLRIELKCTGTDAVPVLDLVARTVSGPATLFVEVAGDATPAPGNPATSDAENDSLTPGADFDLLAGGSGDINQLTFTYHRPGGDLVQGTLTVDVSSSDPERSCRVYGFVLTH